MAEAGIGGGERAGGATATAIVTGAADGIGRALADELARRRVRVVAADVDGEGAERVAGEIRRRGGEAEAARLDVTDAVAFGALVDDVARRWGGLDYLFNNAGIALLGEAGEMDLAAWKRVLAVNLRGAVHGLQAAYPLMVRQGRGHLCNVACVAGLLPVPLATAYSASKHALVGLSTSLRAEAADLGVRVSVVCPGAVATHLFDHVDTIGVDRRILRAFLPRRMLSPERCARAILRGIERDRAIIPVTAHARLSWWLYRLAPLPYLRLSQLSLRIVRRWFGRPAAP
ncbi:MAG: SDR family NAD(P)-dependent oxidoreductase [Acidobacteria bacterium]|nr:MAG: SDR family NAD(P)-dependent oxidoreductase [Acidobacteriota bacterium]